MQDFTPICEKSTALRPLAEVFADKILLPLRNHRLRTSQSCPISAQERQERHKRFHLAELPQRDGASLLAC
jgi:hypothetical protein